MPGPNIGRPTRARSDPQRQPRSAAAVLRELTTTRRVRGLWGWSRGTVGPRRGLSVDAS